MPVTADRVEVDEAKVNRHFKMTSPLGSVNIHSSATALGMWVNAAGSKGADGQIGIFVQNGVANLAIWPAKNSKFPFSISGNGLQVVTSSGKVRIMPLEKLGDLVDRLMDEEEPKRSPSEDSIHGQQIPSSESLGLNTTSKDCVRNVTVKVNVVKTPSVHSITDDPELIARVHKAIEEESRPEVMDANRRKAMEIAEDRCGECRRILAEKM